MKPTAIPFAMSSYRRDSSITPEQICRNFIAEKDESGSDVKTVMLLQRPGFDALLTLGGGNVQAVYCPNNATAGFPTMMAVAGDVVYTISGSTATQVGTITGNDPRVKIISNFDRVAIIANGCLWFYGASSGTTANSFRQIAIPTPYTAVDVSMINDYFVIAMSDGHYYWIVPGGDTLSTDGLGDDNDPALHFADAEAMPDSLCAVTTLNGNVVFLGQDSIEIWQTVGNDTQPFQRLPNSGFSRGCLSRDTVQQDDNSVFFVGEDAKCYRVSAIPERISTVGIEERLKERTGSPSAWSFSYSGHFYYVLNIPGQGSYSYDVSTKNWTEFASEGYTTWRAHVGSSINDTVYCGDSQSGAIWTLSDSPTDAGTLIRRTVSASVVVVGRPVRNDNMTVDIGASASCQVNIRWADADETLADQPFISLQASERANTLQFWGLGQAQQPYREFELEITDPVTVRLGYARIGDTWQ